MGETLVNIARMKAYEQQRRIDELKLGAAERTMAREDEWRSLWGDVFTPQAPARPQPGLTGPPQQGPPPGMPQQGPQQMPMSLADAPSPGPPQGGMPLSQTDFTGPTGMAQNIPTNQWMDVNTQTGEWGMPPAPGLAGAGQPAPPGPPPQAPPPQSGGLTGPPPQGPPQGPQGLAERPNGLPDIPGLQMPQINEQAFWKAYGRDPEKTTKAFSDYVDLQGKKIEQVEKANEMIYNTLRAVEESDDPAKMWPRALKDLRKKGIPIPTDMPDQYDPALNKFLLEQHAGVKTRVELAKERHYNAQTIEQKAKARKTAMETPTTVERAAEIEQKLANVEETLRRTTNIGEKQQLERDKLDLDKEKNMLDAIKADQQAGKDRTAQEQSALREWNNVAKPYQDVSDSMGVVEAAGSKKTPAADFALISAYLKMVDNKTGVRDAERRDAENLGGLPAMLKRGEGYVRGTSRLKDDVRIDLVNRTRDMYKSYMSDYDNRMQQYRDIATSQKLNPDNAVVDFRSRTKRAQEQPASSRGTPPAPAATAEPTGAAASPTIDKADFMRWYRSKGYTGTPKQGHVQEYWQQKG
jgi:hypothetical protein